MESRVLREDYKVQILVALGLTVLQARAYLGLAKLGTAPASAISHFSRVGRQDIYRILTDLQDLGLVKKILTSPAEFEPAPIKPGLSLLLKRRDDETSELRNKVALLCRNVEQIESSVNRKGLKLSAMRGKEALDFEVLCSIKNAKASVKLLTDEDRLKREPQIWKHFHRSLKRGIRIQILASKAESVTPLPKGMKIFVKNLLQIKCYSNQIPSVFMICDDREMFIRISKEKTSLPTAKSLYLNIPELVKIASNYFDVLWKESAPIMNIQ